jgi:hypothetical protein
MPYLESQSVWLRCRMATLLRLNVLRYFLNETRAFRDSPTDSAEEGLVSLSAFRLGHCISTGGRRRRSSNCESLHRKFCGTATLFVAQARLAPSEEGNFGSRHSHIAKV